MRPKNLPQLQVSGVKDKVSDISLHLLDIAENSVAAGATKVEVAVEEDLLHDRLRISVRDDGKGMTGHWVPRMGDPFVTSQATRKVGMGIPLLQAAAEACNGSLIIASEPVQGTTLHVEFQHSHVDRMPLGDLGGTWFALTIGFPQTHWIFRYRLNGAEFIFDDEPIKRALHGIPLTEPDVLTFIRVSLERASPTFNRDSDGRRVETAGLAGRPLGKNPEMVTLFTIESEG